MKHFFLFLFLPLFVWGLPKDRVLDADKFQRKNGSSAVISLPSTSGTLALSSGSTLTNPSIHGGIVSGAAILGGTVSGVTISGDYSSGDMLVASGSTLIKKSVGAQGQVWTVDPATNLPDWMPSTGGSDSALNFILNPSFEQSLSGWTVSGTANLSRYDRSANGVSFINSDRYYLNANSISVNGGPCNTVTIPQNYRGDNIEVSMRYRNGFDVSGTYRMVATTNGIVASQSIVLNPGSSPNVFNDPFLSSPKIYMGTTSSTATAQVCLIREAGTAVVEIDNVWVGSTKSLKTGAIATPWMAYTPTIGAGSGSLTNFTLSDTEYKIVGSDIYIKGQLTFTGAAGTWNTPSISLPLGYQAVGTNNTANMGRATFNDTGVNSYVGVVNNINGNSLTIGSSAGTNGAGIAMTQASPFAFNTNDSITWHFGPIKVQGLTGSSTTLDSVCPTDGSCENIFNANVTTAGVVSGDKYGFVQSCTSFAPLVCTLKTGFFNSIPRCWASGIGNSSATFSFDITYTSTTSITIDRRDEMGVRRAQDLTLFCAKTGNDIVAKKTIEANLSAYNKVVFYGVKTSNEAITGNVTNIAFVAQYDNRGAWNGTTFTVPSGGDGDYMITTTGASAAGNVNLVVYKNGSAYAAIGAYSASVNSGASTMVYGLVAGNTISIRGTSNITVNGDATRTTNISIHKIIGSQLQ